MWLAVFVVVAVAFWWLTQDDRIPDFDAGYHMNVANMDSVALSQGKFWLPFDYYTGYAPLVHIIGAVSILLAGIHPMALTLTLDIVFVPVLAFGCYGTGSLVAGPRAGLLAALFALGAPMIASMFHNFDLDPPEAAMVAVSVWAILASQRFERTGIAVLAGVLCGLTMLTKQTGLVFIFGLLAAVVIRGGWRRPRGLAGFVVALILVGGPWYLYHLSTLTAQFSSIGQLYVNPVQSPARGSLRNWTWYLWNLVNEQISLPFLVLLVIGVAIALRRCLRERFSSESMLPEILAGAAFAYLVMSYLVHKDPRYTLPLIVYVAVLATFWIPQIRRPRLRGVTTTLAVALSIANFAGMVFGIGGTQRVMIALPGADNTLLFANQLTVYQDWGWLRGAPHRDADVSGLLRGLRGQGILAVTGDSSDTKLDFNFQSVTPVAEALGLQAKPIPFVSPYIALLFLHRPRPGEPRPCQVLNDGLGIYAITGTVVGFDSKRLDNPSMPGETFRYICPGRPPLDWAPGHPLA